MRTKGTIKEIRDGIYGSIVNQLNESGALKEIESKGVTSVDDVAKVINAVKTIVTAASYENVVLPDYLFSFKTFDDSTGNVASVAITVKTKLKAEFPYKSTAEYAVDKDFVTNVEKHFINAVFAIFDIELASENLKDVNEAVADICKEHDIPYTIKFVLSDKDTFVEEITDDTVVLTAGIEPAFDVATAPIFQSGDAFEEAVREKYIAEFVEKIKACPNTVSIIKSHASLIDTLTNTRTKKRAERLIRKAYHRKAENLKDVKAGIGYYEAKVNDTEIFALVEKAEDGTLSVVLHPFDIITLVNVDFDVVAALK